MVSTPVHAKCRTDGMHLETLRLFAFCFFFLNESASWKKEKPLALAFLLGHVASKVGASSAESVESDLVSKFRNCFTIVCSKVYVLTWLGLISGDCCRSTRVTPRIGWVNEVNDGWENASL